MALSTKIIYIQILLISIIMIVSPNEKNTLSEFCNIDEYCNTCILCGNGTEDFATCSYSNLFCTEKSTNLTNFQESYLRKYSTFFRNVPNANEFCGQEIYKLDSITNSFSIINKSNKNIKNSNISHCNYEIHNIKYFNNKTDTAHLIIKFNTNNSEKYDLKLIFNILLKNSISKLSKIVTINEIDLTKEFYKITLNDYDNIIMLLDLYVDNKTNTDINEYIEIKIDTENLSNKKNEILKIISLVIISILGVTFTIAINIIYFKRKQIRDLQARNEFLQQEEFKRKLKIEKINKLFGTTLISKKFNEKEIFNDCTECAICLEKFVNNCLICVTPCKHVFHYVCLSNFIETIKAKQKPIIKCPLCKYDFLEDENGGKKLNENNNNENNNNNEESNNNTNQNNNNEDNNNQNNNNENNNNGDNNNENNENNNNNVNIIIENNNNNVNNNSENNMHRNFCMIRPRTINVNSSSCGAATDENLRNHDE